MQEEGIQPSQEDTRIMQLQAESAIADKIAKLTIELAEKEKEMLGDKSQDELVKLKEKDLDIKQSDILRKSEADQTKAGLEKEKILQKERLDNLKRESTEDIAQLRANVALDKVDTQKSQFDRKLVSDTDKNEQKLAVDLLKTKAKDKGEKKTK